MTKREVIAAVMLFLGLLICLGAVGTLDFMGADVGAGDMRSAVIRGLIGLALMVAAIPVSGDCREEIDEEADDDVDK